MRTFVFFILMAVAASATSAQQWQTYNGQGFSLQVPAGWRVETAGQCSDLGIRVYDPQVPARQAFFFGTLGPLYMSHEQKALDQQYAPMLQGAVTWLEMPVVVPFTAENVFANFQQMARTNVARQYMPGFPALDYFQAVSVQQLQSPMQGAHAALVRALFVEGRVLAQGQFQCVAAPFMPATGSPGAGTGMALLAMGISAPKDEFAPSEAALASILSSLTIDPAYANACNNQSQAAFTGVLRAGRTLSEASDIIVQGWEGRQKVHDVLAEKRSDVMMGVERVYNPDLDEVYTVQPDWYRDQYSVQRQQYEMQNLRPLSDQDYDLWMHRAPKPGQGNIR